MPLISSFYGILIYMYFEDHNPPHFHVKYAEHWAQIKIADFTVLQGSLPPKALGLVMEWASIHKEELQENWNLMLREQPFKKINPLQ